MGVQKYLELPYARSSSCYFIECREYFTACDVVTVRFTCGQLQRHVGSLILYVVDPYNEREIYIISFDMPGDNNGFLKRRWNLL
ncbi:hypothetical protein J6590_050869 [Homalodisca vitripennis]|nr:hypothetical protein J6590_050869 [Homalodisca vitripennis]